MNPKFKKTVGCLLCAGLLVSFSGCGDRTNKAQKEEVPTLSWYVPGDAQSAAKDVVDKVNELLVPKIGAKIDLQFVDIGAYSERMKMNMASRKEMDLVFTGWVNPLVTGTNNGSYVNLTDYLPKLAPELWEEMPEYVWEFAKVDGNIYAVPNQQIYALPPAMEIDKKIVEKYKDRFDFNSVKCMEDWEPLLKLIKENEPDMIPYRLNFLETMWTYGKYEEVTTGFWMSVTDPEHKVVSKYEIPEVIQCYKTLTDWRNKGYIRVDLESSGDDTADYNAGMFALSTQLYKPGVELMVKNRTGRDVELFTFYDRAFMQKNGASQTMTAVSATSKHIEECIKFLNVINTDREIYNLICHGIKDKNYTVALDGKITINAESGYNPNADWKFGNTFNADVIEGQPDNVHEETQRINNESAKSPLIGFTFDQTSVKTEVSNISSIPDLNATKFSNDALNEYIGKIKEAGSDKVLAEAQRQVNEFFENKE